MDKSSRTLLARITGSASFLGSNEFCCLGFWLVTCILVAHQNSRFSSGEHSTTAAGVHVYCVCPQARVCRDFPGLWGRSFQTQLAKQGWLPALGSAEPAHQLLWPGSFKTCAQGKPPQWHLCLSTSCEHLHAARLCWAIIACIKLQEPLQQTKHCPSLDQLSFPVWPRARAYNSLAGCRAEVEEEGVLEEVGQGQE